MVDVEPVLNQPNMFNASHFFNGTGRLHYFKRLCKINPEMQLKGVYVHPVVNVSLYKLYELITLMVPHFE